MTDLKFSLRQWLKNPGFAATAALPLALATRANVLVFSVAKAVLFRPLGLEQPDRLVWVRLENTQTRALEDRLSWREMEDIRESARSFEGVATFGSPGAMWEKDGREVKIPTLSVTPGLG